jgi:integral membrane protein
MYKLLNAYYNFRPFSDHEAWGIFKIGAIAEACGWTMLICGILISKYITPGNSVAVNIAGHMHGTLFLIYIVGVLLVGPSLRWNIGKTLLAGLMSAPPYGSLMFELWESHNRKQAKRMELVSRYYYAKAIAA